MRSVIINADDFGRTVEINAAIERALREGVLTSASLMVTGDAVEEAVKIALRFPQLAVGLHVVVASGRAVLSHADLPTITGPEGKFPDDPARQGIRCFFNPAARDELSREIAAQFERFAATGLRLAHVDGHLHMHMHPVVFDRMLPLARKYGAGGIRIPADDLGLALRYDHRDLITKLGWALSFAALGWRARRKLRHEPFATVERVYGLMQSGRMEERYVLRVLSALSASTAELYFHPSTISLGEALGPNPTDLDTLVSPGFRAALESAGLTLSTYRTLRERAA
ncbi:MAG: hopanoid biosynthesis-associated protein HpnK [Thermoanaerobaculia bacterium]